MADIRLAPNIYRTATGWRVYVRELDPRSGATHKVGKRFGPAFTLEQLEAYRDARLEAGEDPAQRGFAADARRYLALKDVQAMPSITTRTIEIEKWIDIFGDTPREALDKNRVSDELHQLKHAGYANSTCNKFRTALMSLWTTLDGRSAANPVRDSVVFQEADLVPRGHSYELLTRILDAIADTLPARARLEVLAFTGMDPSTLGRMTMADFDIAGKWYAPPPRNKGRRRRRAAPRVVVRLPMTPDAAAAFAHLVRVKAVGPFETHSLYQTWRRACARTERQLQAEYDDPSFHVPRIRLKDLRHSFGTKVFQDTRDLQSVAEMLQHAPGSPMTRRYALGAVSDVLRTQMQKVGSTGRRRTAPKVVAIRGGR